MQDKNKYNTPKYRFVPRFTNNKVICQVIFATLEGDKVVAQAQSSELKKFGITCGLANYAAAYATGLLCARRLLQKYKLDEQYQGQTEVNGEYYAVIDNYMDGKHPFKAVLDLGLVATTTGNRVFGALKGAVDGGMDIPHNTKRFPGASKDEDKKDLYDAEVHRDRIFGVHVDNYMNELKEQDQEDFNKQFSQWAKNLKTAKVDSVEALYTKAHEQIRKNPGFSKKATMNKPDRKHMQYRLRRQNAAARKERVEKKFQIALNQA